MSARTDKPASRALLHRQRHAKYAHLHDFSAKNGKYEAIVYTFGRGGKHTRDAADAEGDGRTAQIIVKARNTLQLEHLAARVQERHLSGYSAGDIMAVVRAVTKAITEELRIGNAVNIKGWGSFRTSIKGRLAPAERSLVPHCDVQPYFRPTEAFTAAVNYGAKLVCEEGRKPTAVALDAIRVFPTVVYAYGNFHGDTGISAEVRLPGGETVACTVTPQRTPGSTRPISGALSVTPAGPLPAGASVTLVLKWRDGVGDAQELLREGTVEG